MTRLYFIWFLAISIGAILVAAVQSTVEGSHLQREADARATTLLASLEDPLQGAYRAMHFGNVAKTMDRLKTSTFSGPEYNASNDNLSQIRGLIICPLQPSAKDPARSFPLSFGWLSACEKPAILKASQSQKDVSWSENSNHRHLKFYARSLPAQGKKHGAHTAVLVQDLSGLRALWFDSFFKTFLVYWLVGVLMLVLVATQLRRWVHGNMKLVSQSLRSLVIGRPKPFDGSQIAEGSILQPISREMNELTRKIIKLSTRQNERETAESKTSQATWLADLRNSMGDKKLLVVANREPYIHTKKDGQIQVQRPASGLVTALEPVLRQCGGMWVAHGGGNADRETADAQGMVSVPPGNEKYKLKRVWLSQEEEEGYYYGFSNEGLWPLCHLAHTRPTFRLTDWKYYREVNQKFADAIPVEENNSNSVILVQDYHFALLPQMIKQSARNHQSFAPKVGLFWHIPWPNPETFGICPWNKDLLKGMLGADVVGFHTQYHCNNFLDACNRYLEARVDYERFSVTMENHETFIRAFPIGIDTSPVQTLSDPEVVELKKKYGIRAEKIAVGVDRLDYTKGLVERVEAVERFLEKNPENVGKFSLVQMGSASRTHIPAYQRLSDQLDETIARVNQRFTLPNDPQYKAIVLLPHHDWSEIQKFYQMGDVCMVTSLHDGMNLVAKEYIWCQAPHRGSLILSKFAGASRELSEAFIVNPYSVEDMADAISSALSLSREERVARMSAMKLKVESRNAFNWASELIKAVVDTDDATRANVASTVPSPSPKAESFSVDQTGFNQLDPIARSGAVSAATVSGSTISGNSAGVSVGADDMNGPALGLTASNNSLTRQPILSNGEDASELNSKKNKLMRVH